jgi:integrase
MTSYTIRPLLWTHKENEEGFSPLKICVTINRKRTYVKTPYKLKEGQWDEDKREVKNIANASIINAAIRKQITDLEKEILARQLDGRTISAQAIKHAPITNFYSFVREVKGNTTADKKEMNRVGAFAGASLQLSDIDVQFLRKYEQHERKRATRYKREDKKGMSQNTLNTSFKWLRRVMTLAKNEGLIKNNPFDDYDIPKYVHSERVFLIKEEIDKIEKFIASKPGKIMYETAVYFLFGCYSGLRYSDWLRFDFDKHIQGDRIILRAKKNKQTVSIRIFPRLKKILSRMRKIDRPPAAQTYNGYLKHLGAVCGINKHLTAHVSRHTAATLMATMGVSSDVVAELLGVNKQTVNVYYKITGVKIDRETEVMRKF